MKPLADLIARYAVVFFFGWVACSYYHRIYQISYLQKEASVLTKVEKSDIPALKAEAGCEHWRATLASQIAKRAIVGANSMSAPIPDMSEIPKDCPHASVKVH